MITVEKALQLRTVPLFAQMDLRDLGGIAEQAREVVHAAGEPIVREGERGDCLFVIVEGEVRVHSGSHELRVLGESEYFGEISILDEEPRSASVTALTDCHLLRIDQEQFRELLETHLPAAMHVIRVLARRLREVVDSQTADARTASEGGSA